MQITRYELPEPRNVQPGDVLTITIQSKGTKDIITYFAKYPHIVREVIVEETQDRVTVHFC